MASAQRRSASRGRDKVLRDHFLVVFEISLLQRCLLLLRLWRVIDLSMTTAIPLGKLRLREPNRVLTHLQEALRTLDLGPRAVPLGLQTEHGLVSQCLCFLDGFVWRGVQVQTLLVVAGQGGLQPFLGFGSGLGSGGLLADLLQQLALRLLQP